MRPVQWFAISSSLRILPLDRCSIKSIVSSRRVGRRDQYGTLCGVVAGLYSRSLHTVLCMHSPFVVIIGFKFTG